MIGNRPLDYLSIGIAMAIFETTDKITVHSVTHEQIRGIFYQRVGRGLTSELAEAGVQHLEKIGLVTIEGDPYADTLIHMRDADLRSFCNSEPAADSIYKKAWDAGLEWLTTAFERANFWSDVASEAANEPTPAPIVPSADGFVTLEHNSDVANELERVTTEADEAIRASNSIEESDRTWIRAHLATAVGLIKRGGAILKNALRSLVVDPLRAALKKVAEEGAKGLIVAAIRFVTGLF